MELSYIEKIQIKKTNKITSLYPTTKFFIVIVYIISTLILGTIRVSQYQLPLFLIVQIFLLFILLKLSNVNKQTYKSLLDISILAFIIFLFQILFVQNGDIIFQLSVIKIYKLGLISGFILSFNIINVAGITLWFFHTTRIQEITSVMEEKHVSYKITYVILATFRMIDVLTKNKKKIMDAQKSRGIETEGNILVRIKAFIPILFPILITSIIGIEDQVLTLESRCFSVNCRKSHLLVVKKNGYERRTIIFSVIFLITIILGRIVYGIYFKV